MTTNTASLLVLLVSPSPEALRSRWRTGQRALAHSAVHIRHGRYRAPVPLSAPGGILGTTSLVAGQAPIRPSAPLTDDPLSLADEQGGLAAAVLDRHLKAPAALVVDLDEVHHTPARPLLSDQCLDLASGHGRALPAT